MADAPGFAELYRTGSEGAVLLRRDGFEVRAPPTARATWAVLEQMRPR